MISAVQVATCKKMYLCRNGIHHCTAVLTRGRPHLYSPHLCTVYDVMQAPGVLLRRLVEVLRSGVASSSGHSGRGQMVDSLLHILEMLMQDASDTPVDTDDQVSVFFQRLCNVLE
jgi:hypothetical protein